jgi:mRNA interferase RelE/StbE
VTEPADHRYAIEYDPRALKELGKLDRTVGRRVRTAIDSLATNPRPNGATTLVGYAHFWRIRVGDYRIIYAIQYKRVTVLVVHIAHRREVYRGL